MHSNWSNLKPMHVQILNMPTPILAQRVQRRYTIDTRIKLLVAYEGSTLSANAICALEGIPRSTWQTWHNKKEQYMSTQRNKRLPSLGGQGRPVSMKFACELLAFMRSVRKEGHHLTTAHMVTWIKTNQQSWVEAYLKGKEDSGTGYTALLGMCHRFAHRHGFAQRVPCYSKLKRAELNDLQSTFAAAFWTKYGHLPLRDIVNVDETAVYYDMPPRRIWCPIGEDASSDTSEKHSHRLTAVLGVCADGTKLPILFIVRGKPGGPVETEELPTYPAGHIYAVQETAWMDEDIWIFYLKELLKFELGGPTALLVDNLAAHASLKSRRTVDEDLYSFLAPLPPNTTSVCQPLDVGVMGPLKAKLCAKWLLETPVVTPAEKRLKMIERTISAWDEISESAVMKSFVKALPRL
ncbi:Aste57867_17136 [Aphanomyces stellatus]|uniref:Aste57867_17136 protein n=1 Tax=Aphanomyces stellatus TaxID=120398 RepID=A0A485KGV7_9STRA|nr:hypothetical protein As57867_017077 [Aphanomyces stellatus]KAF0701241.1 hypothetical protein As57867_008204 [Aphanomyces stellatus]KAF0701572.1 hypothetical protein As57867_007963 [Aphanomyces stellatus]KAF0710905.1 hypothetical protein As57867_005432 [Aphanomyces stellatus]KAF0713033.1 hypothetical protein As57867_004540 [Aphanomyces stellatus]